MNRLEAALQRLYGYTSTGEAARGVLLVFRRSRDWPRVAEVLRMVQEDLDLPAPAVSVSGESGFSVWFALAGPVSPGEGMAFLEGLRRVALPDMAEADLELLAAPANLPAIPACSERTGRWSAFIDPGMGSLFVDEAGLDIEPTPERQADLLAGLKCMDGEAFRAALAGLPSAAGSSAATSGQVATPTGPAGVFSQPRDFLLAVMNDPAVPLALRIDAAKALLSAGGQG